jgi:hypothetical protein
MDYDNILKKSKKIDWYGELVPEKLITPTVKKMAEQIEEQINKYEGVDAKNKKDYICLLWQNIKNLPYKINGDFYLIKKQEIEKVKTKEPKKHETIEEEPKRKTKNSNLIFGKNKK